MLSPRPWLRVLLELSGYWFGCMARFRIWVPALLLSFTGFEASHWEYEEGLGSFDGQIDTGWTFHIRR